MKKKNLNPCELLAESFLNYFRLDFDERKHLEAYLRGEEDYKIWKNINSEKRILGTKIRAVAYAILNKKDK